MTIVGSKTLPDFLIVGAAKAGTSALYRYLDQHPQIFMPNKEIRFFAFDDGDEARYRMERFGKDHFSVRTLAEYQALFVKADSAQVRGEVAPIYLESERAASRIRETIPDVKLIASLRNPIMRAFSGYVMQVRSGREHRDLHDAFDEHAHHVRASLYFEQVKRYLDRFPREQVLLLRYEAFKADNEATLRNIFEFLGVDPTFRPDLATRHNVSTFPRIQFLNSLIENRITREVLRPMMPKWARKAARNVKTMNLGDVPEIPPAIHAKLLDIYRPDIERLQDLTGIDFSSWLTEPGEIADRATTSRCVGSG